MVHHGLLLHQVLVDQHTLLRSSHVPAMDEQVTKSALARLQVLVSNSSFSVFPVQFWVFNLNLGCTSVFEGFLVFSVLKTIL